MTLRGKTVLVTGGAGFIGSHIVELLLHRRARVIVPFLVVEPISYFMSKKLQKQVILEYADVRNFERMFDLVTRYGVEYVFHLAAQPLVEVANHNPKLTLETNILGTINVLEAARQYRNIRGLIIASSDKAYGKLEKNTAYREDDALKGDHPYEASKAGADIIANAYHKTYGIPVVTTRFGNVYGEGDTNYSRILPGIMQSLITKTPLLLRSDGTYVRDYVYVKDVARGYLQLAQKLETCAGEAYNFGSTETLSVKELIELTQRTLHKKLSVKILNSAKNEIPYQSLDYTKIQKAIGWKPLYLLKTTLKNMYQWYGQHT